MMGYLKQALVVLAVLFIVNNVPTVGKIVGQK